MRVCATPIITLLLIVPAVAQEPPRIGYLYPAGGQQGTAVEIAVGGRYFNGAKLAEVSGEGVRAAVVAQLPASSSSQAAALKQKLRTLEKKKVDAAAEVVRVAKVNAAEKRNYEADLKKYEAEKLTIAQLEKDRRAEVQRRKQVEQERQRQLELDRQKAIKTGKPAPRPTTAPAWPALKKIPTLRPRPQAPTPHRPRVVWTPQDEKTVAEIKRTLPYLQQRRSSPWIGETVVLQITIDAGAEPGERQLRLTTQTGVSNARTFCVGQWPEFRELPPSPPAPPTTAPATAPVLPGRRITLPAVVNGQIMPGEVDRFHFHATRGQRLVIATSARQLVPYMPDAVPGWFQAVVSLHDANGKCLAYADGYRFLPDPVFYHEIPADGDYILQIRDSIYRGREDFVYRVTVGQVTFISSVFPLGARLGSRPDVQMSGWNLATSRATPPTTMPGVQTLAMGGANTVSFAVDALAECNEVEPNNAPAEAQRIAPPVIVNGRIDRPGDWDVFRFEGKAGQEIVAEVHARRLGSPLDSVLILTDSAGQRLAFNDDYEDRGAAMVTHHADSYILTKLPADGTYYLYIGDAQRHGGPDYAYRLRLSEPRADFELRAVPSSISVRAGETVAFNVYALRKDGFAGDIDLAIHDAPAGSALSGGRIPAGQDRVRVTMTATTRPTTQASNMRLDGSAAVRGEKTVRTAVAADDMMQAFIYHHLVPAGQLKLLVLPAPPAPRPPAPPPPGPMRLASGAGLAIPEGGTARLRVIVPAVVPDDKLVFVLSEPPEGLSIGGTTTSADGAEIMLCCDASKAKAGLRGNLIIAGTIERTIPATKPNAKPSIRKIPQGILPAVAFEVVQGR